MAVTKSDTDRYLSDNKVPIMLDPTLLPEEPELSDDLLRIYAGLESGAISAGSFLYNQVKELTGWGSETPDTPEERQEQLARLQTDLRSGVRESRRAEMAARRGETYTPSDPEVVAKEEAAIFDEEGRVRPTETTTGGVADFATDAGLLIGGGVVGLSSKIGKELIELGIKSPNMIPKVGAKIAQFGKFFAGEQLAEQTIAPAGKNLFNTIEDTFPDTAKNEVVAFFAADDDDSEAELRLKTSLVSLGIGVGFGLGIEGIKAGGRGALSTGIPQKTGEAIKETALITNKFIRSAFLNVRQRLPDFPIKLENLTPEDEAEVVMESLRLAREATRNQQIRIDKEFTITGQAVPVRKDLPSKASLNRETPEELAQIDSQTGGGVAYFKRFGGRFLSSRGFLTPKSYQAWQDADAGMKTTLKEAANNASRLKASIDKVGNLTADGGGTVSTKVMMERASKALEADGRFLYEIPIDQRVDALADTFGLTREVAEEVLTSRIHIDRLSKRLVNNKYIDDDSRAVIAGQVGRYMKRSFDAYEDPNFKPEPQAVKEANEFFYDEIIGNSASKIKELEEESDEAVELFLAQSKIEAEKKTQDVLAGIDSSEVNDYITSMRRYFGLMQKKNLSDVERKLLGEIKDPSENVILTVGKMANTVEMGEFYAKFKQLGESGGYIVSGVTTKANSAARKNKGLTERIQGTGYYGLDGIDKDPRTWRYTTPELAQELRREVEIPSWVTGNNVIGSITRGTALMRGTSQSMKTVWNNITHARNATGAAVIMLANGINPLASRGGQKPFKTLANSIADSGYKDLDKAYEKFLRLGLLDTNVKISEVKALVSTGTKSYDDRNTLTNALENVTGGKPGSVLGFPGEIYRATDDYSKLVSWTYELDILKKARPDEALDVLEQEAALIVRSTLPNYPSVPKGVKSLRYIPLSKFTGFASESVRVTGNIVKRGYQELTSKNPELVKRGMQRLTGFSLVGMGGYQAAGKTSEMLMGWTKEEARAHNILAEGKYYENSTKLWHTREDGTPAFYDTRYLDPFNVVKEPFLIIQNEILARKEDGTLDAVDIDSLLLEAAVTSTVNFLDPYIGLGLVTESVSEAYYAIVSEKGEDSTGKVLLPPKMTLDEKLKTISGILFEPFIPGFIPNAEKFMEALEAKQDPYAKRAGDVKRNLQTELYANIAGVRSIEEKLEYGLKIAVDRYTEQSGANYLDSLNWESTPEEFYKDYLKVQEVERGYQEQLHQVVAAYEFLNGKEATQIALMDVNKKLRIGTSKFSAKSLMLDNIIEGYFTPLDPMATLNKQVLKRAEADIDFEGFSTMAEALQATYRQLQVENLKRYEEDTYDYKKVKQKVEDKGYKLGFNKGGEVLDVPNVPTEPDQRIDKMTGLPYDQQAGTAFVDEEDPIRRLGFGKGGYTDPLQRLGFGVGGTVLEAGLKLLFTPTKTVGKQGSKRVVKDEDKLPVMTQSEELTEELDPRMGRAMESDTASSVMPAPGKFFNPEKSSYKEGLTKKAKDAGIEIDLEFGKYLKMGRELTEDVSNKTFQNLYVTPRPSEKLSTFGQNNKSIARANEYDGPDLTIDQMKANYKKNTGVKNPARVQTNLLQPEQFKIMNDEGPMRLDNPIVSVETSKAKGGHFYALDYQLVGPVRMNVLTSKKADGKVKSPNLRPETVGEVKLGNIIGTIKTSGKGDKTHPLYDYIEVDGTPSLPEGVTKRDKFVRGGRVLGALKRGQYQKGSEVRSDMRRSDGSTKSASGYLGPIKNKVSGGTMTEFATNWEDAGIEIPTMVPTLSKKEIEYMQNMKPGQGWNVKENPMDKQIINKAREHARMRLEQDKNPFYQDGE